MKKISVLLAFILPFMASCGNFSTISQASEDEAALVSNAVSSGNVTVEVNYVTPDRMPAYATSDGYTLSLKDGKVNAHLPFRGTSYIPSYGASDDGGINFRDCPVTVERKHLKDREEWRFDAMSGTEKVSVTLTIWANAGAEIFCSCTSRSNMRYSGTLK